MAATRITTVLPALAPAACPPTLDDAPLLHDALPHADERAHTRCQRWTLAVVCTATALLLFNVTAPNVALPAIARDLSARFDAQQWVLSVYALVLASLLLAGGALGDRYGRRRLFLLGLAVFGFASLCCSLAGSPLTLIVSRCLQGVGAALLFPSSLALIAAEFDGAARARAIGVWGATVSGAIAAGPLFGGVLVEALSWRATFLIGAVLALPALALGVRHLRESRAPAGRGIDWPGTALLTVAMFLAVFALLRGNALGWTSATVLGCGVGAVALAAAFVAVEHRVRDPLVAPALLRNPTFLAVTAVALCFAAAGFGPIVYLTQLLITVLGGTPIAAGAELLPFAAASFVVALLAARVAARLGTRVTLTLGLLLCAAALLAMHGIDASSGWMQLLAGLVLFGAGGGLVNPTMTVAALSVVPPSQSGMASGVNNTARQLGIAAGIATLGAVVQSRVASEVQTRLVDGGVGRATAHAAAQLASDGRAAGAARRVFGAAYAAAVDTVLLVAAGVAVAGAVVVVALMRD